MGVGAFSDKGSSYSFGRGIKIYNLGANDASVNSLNGTFINAAPRPSGGIDNYILSPRKSSS